MPYAGLSLEGMTALVTGSGRGIGSALAVGLAQAGANVAVSDVSEGMAGAEDTAARIRQERVDSAAYVLDVLNLENIRHAVDSVVQKFGRLDILVNNAGIRRRQPALEVTEANWDAVIDTNLKGPFFCAQAAAKPMIERGFGRIINISSQLAVVAGENRAAYCASKAGLANLTRVLALEWLKYGITVNAIGPGPTETPGLLFADTRTDEELAADLRAHMPLGRRMTADELVGAAIYLASPSAGATTGQLLVVDGGWTII
ncbi:MAG: SDR family oxidoreductase [Chloroflexota bacterium]|nr:SDR family oxidoreductase [Chloroflexota bacterium]